MTKLLTHILFLVAILFTFHLQSEAASKALPVSKGPECVKATNRTMANCKLPHVVLVHGFTSGGWYFYKTRCALESMGYKVTSIDLKGSGINPADAASIYTLEEYNEPLDHLMTHLPKNEKVGIVAHSAGGVSVTKILHDYPDKIQFAMYVCATMIRNGYETCEHLIMGVPHFKKSKCHDSCPKLPDPSCFEKAMLPSNQEFPIGAMEDYVLSKSLSRTGPYRAICTSTFPDKSPGGKKKASIDKIPRVYVKTLNDRTVTPDQQDAMLKLWPPCEIHEIPNDHDFPISKPQMLASFIINATLSYGAP